jgi:hypothetical protein
MLQSDIDINEIANNALGVISAPTFSYAEVRGAFNSARHLHGKRITFKTFLEKTGLGDKIFLKGSTGGTRVMYKTDVVEAFDYFVELHKSEMPQAPYKRKVSVTKQAKGLLLGYAKLYAPKKGGSGEDRNKLKNPLVSPQNWRAIASGLKKDGRGDDLEILIDTMERAGIDIPTNSQ